MKKILITLFITAISLPLWAQSIQISQLDTNNLLFKGEIDIYFSLPGEYKKGLSVDDFSIYEKNIGKLEVKSLKEAPNRAAGIDFILLIDNSGSMYEENYQGSLRITQAKLALNSFLDRIEKSGDSAAVYAFNTSLEELAPFGTGIPEIRRSISALSQPKADEAYTELYNSLAEVSKSFPRTSGRRAVIVLSDGENYSLYLQGGRENPDWDDRVVEPQEIVQTYLQAGITLDGINISDSMDANLKDVCNASGGKFHNVRSTEEISNVYTDIREKIINEYMITVTAPPLANNPGEIMLEFNGGHDSRMLIVPILFGGTSPLPLPLVLLLLLLGLAGIVVLYFIPFEKPVKTPQIQNLESNQRTVLNNDVTLIGASSGADYTIAGNPGIDAEHATIVHNEETGVFTIVSKKAVRVNNKKVKNRILTPGDVIRIEDATIIFDAPDTEKIY